MLHLGDIFPNFTASTTEGEIDFHDWLGDSWGILFSHPSDFTPVCTTELARVITLCPEFTKRNVKVIGLSCDSISSHYDWCKDIQCYAGSKDDEKFPYPIIEDKERHLAAKLGMVDKDELDSAGMPLTARAVFIVDPKKKFKLSILYPATTGRNFDEILRVLDSLQLTDKVKVATPVDWKEMLEGEQTVHLMLSDPDAHGHSQIGRAACTLPALKGDECMVLPTVPEENLDVMFPQGVSVVPLPSGKKYLRKTPCPDV